METNREIDLAWDFVEHTGKSVFLTGRAGTGKTTFLRRVKEESTKSCVVVAPTGVAAINAHGSTIHSFFQISPAQPYVPGYETKSKYNFSKVKRRILASLDLLIIDEISMVRCDLLDAVNDVLQRYRHSAEPFGGVQLLMIGDLQQLTPVVTPGEEQILQKYYETPYFFSSRVLQRLDYVTIELEHVYRQQQGTFLDILNHIRDGHPTAADLQQLNSRFRPDFVPKPGDGYIRLTTHNHSANSYNKSELAKLPGEGTLFQAMVKGKFPNTNFPTEESLLLKEGAQVMFVRNDPNGNYYNGLIGHVQSIESDSALTVALDDGSTVDVAPISWENTSYTLNEKTKQIESQVEGTFTQMPLRLAWAITIHKSQGLTFDRAIIEADAAFASGQVYVALSRCRTLEGLIMACPISERAIINDQRVTLYTNSQHEAAQRSIGALPALQAAYLRQLLSELFNFDDLLRTQSYFHRQLDEHFSRFNRTLLTLHTQALERTQKDVVDVAHKWQQFMNTQPDEVLHSEAFIERVQKGCEYFFNQILPLNGVLRRSLKIDTKAHEAIVRLQGAFADLEVAFLTKFNLLHLLSKQPFSVSTYLRCKQLAVLRATEGMGESEKPQGTTKQRKQRKKRSM